MGQAETKIVLAEWRDCHEDADRVRREVFVIEQHVPSERETDGLDPACMHAVAYDAAGMPIGTGRLLPDAHIGRMAVLAPWRGRGVGAQLLRALVEAARQRGDAQVMLSAQLAARAFYARHGFEAEGETYMDAGIEHIAMRCPLVGGSA